MPEVVEEIEVILSEPQTAVLESRQAVILEMAGQGGGKSQNIGYSSGMFVSDFPQVRQFIGANTYLQLSQSTLFRVFETWKSVFGFIEYDKRGNPLGAYVTDKKPPLHFNVMHKPKDYRGTISFWNGALIFTGSLENYSAHEGKEFGIAHLDETKDTKEAALKEVILGRLRQYGLWFDQEKNIFYDVKLSPGDATAKGWKAWTPLYIHTSPAMGGVDWLNKMFYLDKFAAEIKTKVIRREKDFFYKEFENKAVCIYSAYHNEHNLRPGYLQDQEENLGPDRSLKLVHGYPFSRSGGEYYPHFRRDWHVGYVPYVIGLPVHSTWDFNVVPYMTNLCVQFEYVLKYIDERGKKHLAPALDRTPVEVMKIRVYREYCFKNPRNSVASIGAQFREDHDPAFTEVYYYGDAMGLNRIEGLGSVTRFSWVVDELYAYLHNDSKKVKAPNVTPLKRRDLLDEILKGKYPQVEIQIDESCTELIADLENLKEGKKGKIKQEVKDEQTGGKYEKHGHASDALEYLVSEACKFLLNNS